MNIGKFNPNIFNRPDSAKNSSRQETGISFEADEKRLRNTALKKDDLVNKFLNMTDSMPRDNQVAFAATVIAGRIMNQGMTDENQAFMKNISNRFSPEEIGALKKQVMAHPAASNKSGSELEKFLNDFEQTISEHKNHELDPLNKQQASPKLRSADDIFFQMTSTLNPLYKALAA